MWISKKKWNRMCDKISEIEVSFECRDVFIKKLDARVVESDGIINGLIEAHNEIEDEEEYLSFPNGMYGHYEMKKRKTKKYNHAMDTKTIPNVTLEELAKLVIDGTPIVREQTIKVKKEYGRGE